MAVNRQPLGIELVRRGIVKQDDVTKALQLQRESNGQKLGDILYDMNVTEADKLLSSEKLTVVYIGRETCPYCRKFAKKLGNLYNKLNTVIYYVNSEDFSDNEISSFREKYHVVTVPGFIVSKNGKYEIRCDSSMSEDEIINMLK